MKRILSAVLAFVLLCPAAVSAQEDFAVIINGSAVKLDHAPQTANGVTMVPVKEILERLGFFIETGEYDRRGVMKTGYLATVNGAEMIVPPDSPEACYDQVWFELDEPTRAVEGDILVPLEFVSYLYGITAVQDGNQITITGSRSTVQNIEDLGDSEIDALIAALPQGDVIIGEADLLNPENRDASLLEIGVVEVDDGTGFTQALEMTTLQQPSHNYDAQIQLYTKGAVERGDLLILTFWGRTITSSDESGSAMTIPCFENTTTFVASLAATGTGLALPGSWRRYRYVFTAVEDSESGASRLCMRAGFKPQTMQIAGLEVVNYHQVSNDLIDTQSATQAPGDYYGREEDALWRQEALKRIEKYRVRDIRVEVTDENGVPVPDAEVSAAMTTSEFLWGSIGPTGSTGTLERLNMIQYQAKMFNTVTPENDMKISTYHENQGIGAVNTTNFAIDNDLRLHGHCLMYDGKGYMEDWLKERIDTISEEELRAYYYEYAGELIGYFGDAMVQLDVINEPRSNHESVNRFGWDFVADVFRLVELLRDDYAPDMKMYLNETGINGSDSSWNYVYTMDEQIRALESEGADVEGAGHQVHTSPIYYPQALYNQIDYSSDLVEEITVTEYDCVTSVSTMTRAEKELRYADYLRDMLIMTYSHPKGAGFIMWGFYDPQHWRGISPMLSRQYSEKPPVQVWRELVMGEWKTDTGGTTDETGLCAMRGHRGDYDVTVRVGGQSAATTLKVTDTGENTVRAVVKADGSIELTSSEEVVKKQVQRKNFSELDLNRRAYQNLYKQYQQNIITGVAAHTGETLTTLTDGQTESYWASSGVDSYLVCELNERVKGGTLKINWRGDGLQHLYKIEGSTDKENWTTLQAGIGSGEESVRLVNTDMQYIRIRSLTDTSILISELSFSKL